MALQDIRKPAVLNKLLIALALQLGSEVSFNELGQLVGTDRGTVERYIDLLEKSFVIFQVRAFSRNLRNELKKARKIYFYDTGIRNALLNNFTPLALRNDTGGLWENFLIAERVKYHNYKGTKPHFYFWRTVDQQEIDWLEEINGQLSGFEFKWNPDANVRFSKTFTNAYPTANLQGITPKNYWEFCGIS